MVLGLLIAGGVGITALIGGAVSYVKRQKTLLAREETKQLETAKNLSADKIALSSNSIWDDFFLTARTYAVPILVGVVVLAGTLIVLRKDKGGIPQ